jgi:[ribosomal protein S18]-alanine N-acetyltransferase
MKSPLDYFRKREFAIQRLKTTDAVEISGLHTDGFHRPWNDGEFHSLLAQGPVFGFIARPVGNAGTAAGFVLARLAANEAEILTLAVSKQERRSGIGRKLMDAVLRELHAQRAESLFLEVDEKNAAAIGLYRKLGFREVGRRPSYYQTAEGRSSALVMRLDLK